MTPLHPFAAVAAGTMLGLAALTAPNTIPTQGLPDTGQACQQGCAGTVAAVPPIGQTVPADSVHRVTMPGRYGLAGPPDGQEFAIIAGHLVRIDAADRRVLSVLRPVPRLLD